MVDLTYFAPFVCDLMGCNALKLDKPQAPSPLASIASERCDKVLIYAPDAIGAHLLKNLPSEYSAIRSVAPIELELMSSLPPKTPVCFTTMLTGVPPEVHGIQSYERPVITRDTVFDMLVREWKKAALVVVRDSSLDLMFTGRQIDYFSEQYDPEVTARALELIEQNEHDFILAYHQEYDDLLHKHNPYGPECLAALASHAAAFASLAAAAHRSWKGSSYAIAFCPDHGGHIDHETGRGDHGLDIPEDMEILHFWGCFPA